ncbi:hypothetical protein PIB30_004082 [Stylosanthes scabra]|uniref:Uncharacterized protein n=1 Tax=Stylosanthes scabra TaxID=79078 RepID=A0ABU6Z253_9FABA|nr:hypothetical protein [Stylosanthes scabra]
MHSISCHPDEIPVDATQRQTAPHPRRSHVSDVPDRRRLGRQMIVGTRTTMRDCQWVEEMMADDAEAAAPARCPRRMLEGSRRGRSRSNGRGRGEGGDTAPSQKTQGGASTSHVHEADTSTQAVVPGTPQTRRGVSTPTFGSPSQAFPKGLIAWSSKICWSRYYYLEMDTDLSLTVPSSMWI